MSINVYADMQCPDSGLTVVVRWNGGRVTAEVEADEVYDDADESARTATHEWVKSVNGCFRSRRHRKDEAENILIDRFGVESDSLDPWTW